METHAEHTAKRRRRVFVVKLLIRIRYVFVRSAERELCRRPTTHNERAKQSILDRRRLVAPIGGARLKPRSIALTVITTKH